VVLRDAKTGAVLWKHSPGVDFSHGVAADIDPRYPGMEVWDDSEKNRDASGNPIGPCPRMKEFVIWWDGDLLRELLAGSSIFKWNWEKAIAEPIFTADSGRTLWDRPNLAGDLLGDWREELLVTGPDRKSLRLYVTTIPTEYRLYTLMHDPQYRLSIAWQNVAYNKPAHTSFFLGHNMAAPPKPNIFLVGNGEAIAATADK